MGESAAGEDLAALVARAVEHGGLPVDDVLALVVPLLEQVRAAHEIGRVAPLRGLGSLRVDDSDRGPGIGFDPAATRPPTRNPRAIAETERATSAALDVRRGADRVRDLTGATATPGGGVAHDVTPRAVSEARIVAGWQRWEHLLEHHDELTDIGSLGELLVALSCGLDLGSDDDAARLARNSRNLFALAPGIHPVVAGVATSMVEPDRRRRAQDLAEVVERLRTYRDQPTDLDLDRVLAEGAGGDRRAVVLGHLRERLFDLTRRNPLLHFRPTQRTLNLTQASVPLVLDVRSIRPEQLLTWGGPASESLRSGRAVQLSSVVRWEDAPYAAPSLDALISTARRDRAEYGQDQLRLVAAFLHWQDVKNDPGTPILSPLVLAPVTLAKQRGVRDSYRLQLVGTEAEVNPVLRHQLRELYDFALPETVDLADPAAMESLRAGIEQQARRSQPGVGVTLVDRPRIELIRSRAQTALQSFRRRRAGRGPTYGRRTYAYSYTRPGWVPLGIQIFRDRLVRLPLPISVELGDAPVARVAPVSLETEVAQETSTETFVLDAEGDSNPFAWEVDLCQVTLANFNYRTLSLVRDYDALLATPTVSACFDELFSTAPRQLPAPTTDLPVADQYLVVPSDGSQLQAIAQARTGDNFVIQGPPGTGKSQTITNLVADALARGQRVLFVCAKRAALDVVHARLRAQGLGEVCTLVHDSQADKKDFVLGLRATYESWLAADDDLATAEATRAGHVAELAGVHEEIRAYDAALAGGAGVLLDRLIVLADHAWGADLTAEQRRLLPDAAQWTAARPAVDGLVAALRRVGADGVLAHSAVRFVDPSVLEQPRADAAVATAAAGALSLLDRTLGSLAGGPDPGALTIDGLPEVQALATLLGPLLDHGVADVLKQRSASSTRLRADSAAMVAARDAAHAARGAAAGWTSPPPPAEARAALEVARSKESAALRIFSGEWRRVRRLVEAGCPTATGPSQALTVLVASYDADEAVAALSSAALAGWGHPDPVDLEARLKQVRRLDGPAGTWRDALVADDALLLAAEELPADLATALSAGWSTPAATGIATASELRAAASVLAGADGPALVRAAAGPLLELASRPTVLAALRQLAADPDQLEHAVLQEAVQDAVAAAPALDRLDGVRLAELVRRVAALTPLLQRAHAQVVVARLRDRFRAGVELSQRSVSGMSPADRATKKSWAAGRRELEHEFGKVRAYKAIRQLASDDAGAVVAAMRPVWLMSPASLSDTLPLVEAFDMVVFDEASQVPVEEAVPALHRARQVIVVGDRMQLPPTSYFRAGGTTGEGTDDDGEDAQQIGVVLDADSLLAVGSVRLPSTMLTWHYRSRYEALIGFSNAAFYGGRLATIPDRAPALPPSAPLTVSGEPGPDDAGRIVDALLARSVSSVRVADGVYDHRTNAAEAGWIAALVRDLLARDTGLTLGIVAFSEAQQGEIERALEALGTRDPDFAARYEAELTRETDGQALGLFVKNLENVQGDERDVILISVCYGPAADGRMRMSFGPINNAGGEKRLNVIFSRARQHLVLVTSIEHTAVTNLYNDGANTLKGFLRYAAAMSEGDAAGAAAVLASFRNRLDAPASVVAGPAADRIAAALVAHGVEVVRDLGQSGFRCDLALRLPGEDAWTTAVLVDSVARAAALDSVERRLTQPAALASAGWRVEQVTATEWVERPDEVVERLAAAVRAASPEVST